jgi:hypothetical protein
MAVRDFVILRKLRSSCLEGRTMLFQLNANFLTASFAGEAFDIFLSSGTALSLPGYCEAKSGR